MRGFGKISPRNGSSFGLGGERAFADTDRAVRFVEHIELQQEGWDLPLHIFPWFRRLYFDGYMSGRFEFGFMVNDVYETLIFDMTNNTINPSLLAQTILSTNIIIKSIDGSRSSVIFANCAKLLGYAYISATTSNAALDTFPVSDTLGSAVFVGKPMLHMRISSGRTIETDQDRRVLNNEDEPQLFITSARGSATRNNVIVQASKGGVREESASERVTRVLFAHLNALLYAYAQFVRSGPTIEGVNKRTVLRTTIEKMIQRLQRLQNYSNSEDLEFVAGMQRFANAYAGRIDALAEKLESLSEEWNSPTTAERFKGYISGVHDLVIKTMVDAVTTFTLKGGS